MSKTPPRKRMTTKGKREAILSLLMGYPINTLESVSKCMEAIGEEGLKYPVQAQMIESQRHVAILRRRDEILAHRESTRKVVPPPQKPMLDTKAQLEAVLTAVESCGGWLNFKEIVDMAENFRRLSI